MKISYNSIFFSAVSALFLSSCATGKTIVLKNEQGQTATCQVSGMSAAMTGSVIRNMELKQCIEQYQGIGYKRVDGDKPLPVFDFLD